MKKNKDSESAEFRNYLSRFPNKLENISLVHITDLLTMGDIEAVNKLVPTHDDNFDANLLYFFYGRPAYEIHSEVENTRISAFAPVCFVLKKNSKWRPSRIYPFDTGAFFKNRMSSLWHPSFNLKDFEMEPMPDSPKALIQAFYGGSNRNYVDCNPDHSIDRDELGKDRMHRVETYLELVEQIRNDGSDERLHTVEIHVEHDIELKDNLLAVIVPERFFNRSQQVELEKRWGCPVVLYYIKSVFSPSDLMGLLFDKVRQVLVQDGQIS